MNTLDQQLHHLFRQAVLTFYAQREMLRGLIHDIGFRHPFVRATYRAMPPVAQCQELALRARAQAARLMPAHRSTTSEAGHRS